VLSTTNFRVSQADSSKQRLPEIQDQHMVGLGMGFRGQKIFYLGRNGMANLDVPQGLNIQRALEVDDVKMAYKIACLGATEADWKLLAMRALRSNHLAIAKTAFARLKDTKFLSLVDNIQRNNSNNNSGSISGQVKANIAMAVATTTTRNRNIDLLPAQQIATGMPTPPLGLSWVAELMAFEGHFQEAAKTYSRAGKHEEAIRLLTDLRLWEEAKMFKRNAGHSDVSDLSQRQAKWLQETNDWKGAADMYVAMGQHLVAAKLVAESNESNWAEALIEIVRSCPVDVLEALEYCGEKFATANETEYARETFTKSKNITRLMTLYAKQNMWKEAAKLADENEGKFDVTIFLSYAEWLISQDRFEEAMHAYKKSGRFDLSKGLLLELTSNAVSENRFKDASYYYWILSKESAEEADRSKSAIDFALVKDFEWKADLYISYSYIFEYVSDPFTTHTPEMLFHTSRFIINSLGPDESTPPGISRAFVLYTLAKQSMTLGAYKLARHVFERVSKLQLPPKKYDEIQMDMLLVQAKPVRDDPDQLPVCYRCSSTNPLLNPFTNKYSKGDVCTNCGHPFVRSFINFDILPLVEFVPESTISEEEAIEMIRQPANSKERGMSGRSGWKEMKSANGDADVLTLDDDKYGDRDNINNLSLSVDAGDENDQFTRCANKTIENQVIIIIIFLL
jgi:intraflagellar transport protein 122